MDFLADVESCIPSLRRYARALLHHAADADDLVQDCLERAIGRRHLWLGGDTVRPWLFRIMRNIHANHARRLHGGPAFEPIEGTEAEPADAVAGAGPAGSADNVRCPPQESPDAAPPNNVIAPFWSDLTGDAGTPAGRPETGIYVDVLTDGVDSWLVVESDLTDCCDGDADQDRDADRTNSAVDPGGTPKPHCRSERSHSN